MKIVELTQKTDKELQAVVTDTRKELAQLAIDMRTKQMPNVKQVQKLKKTIARALTVQNDRLLKEEHNG